MLLYHSHTSPFVRKVTMLLHETGLIEQVELVTVDGWTEPERLVALNPLSMVPTLELTDGTRLYDSPVICEYLDGLHGGRALFPAGGPARWQALRRQAAADGVLDAAVTVFVETIKRPPALRWPAWIDLKQRAILRALDDWEGECPGWVADLDIGGLSIAVALAYLDLRGAVGDWRAGRPVLTAWHAECAHRPSMLATRPPG